MGNYNSNYYWNYIFGRNFLSIPSLRPIRNYYACEGIKIDRNKYSVYGIDVSSHQGEIDWQKSLKRQYKSFVFKATEEDFVDKI